MVNVLRIYRYARQHIDNAEKQLAELKEIRLNLNVRVNRVVDIYTESLANGYKYVPITFMRRDNEFNRYRVRMEEKQNLVVTNLAFSLSFCSELVSLMAQDLENEAWEYKVRIRQIIDRVITVALDEAMNTASLTSLVPAIIKMESDIVLNDATNLGLIKRNLLEFRTKIS